MRFDKHSLDAARRTSCRIACATSTCPNTMRALKYSPPTSRLARSRSQSKPISASRSTRSSSGQRFNKWTSVPGSKMELRISSIPFTLSVHPTKSNRSGASASIYSLFYIGAHTETQEKAGKEHTCKHARKCKRTQTQLLYAEIKKVFQLQNFNKSVYFPCFC